MLKNNYLLNSIVGIITFILCFIGGNYLITLVVSPIESSDSRVIMKVVLWVFCIGPIFWLSTLLTTIVVTAFDYLLDYLLKK
jgi:hypothetical protein